ncbi:hypothetical protein MP638_004695, partial [Amoeboaphelidium occidentale]
MSKASMELRGYTGLSNDQVSTLYKPFLANGKISRRAPLIHRGYYIRQTAINRAVEWFLEEADSSCTKQIISVGCGYDFIFGRLKMCGLLHNNVSVIDIDLPDVVSVKRNAIDNDKTLKDWTSEHSSQYNLFTCDVRDTVDLVKKLQTVYNFSFSNPTLIISECVLTYMPSEDADNVLKWFSKNFSDSMLVLYEQIYPDDVFGKQMISHFKKKLAPIFSIYKYPKEEDQLRRIKDVLGYQNASVVNMNQYWDCLISWQEKNYIEGLEPFDEYEEWHTKCKHYFVGYGTNGSIRIPHFVDACEKKKNFEFSGRNCTVKRSAFPLKRWGHTAHALKGNTISLIGGYGSSEKDAAFVRRNDVQLISSRDNGDYTKVAEIANEMPASMYHSSVLIGDEIIVFGGRSSPGKCSGDLVAVNVSTGNYRVICPSEEVGPSPRYHQSMVLSKSFTLNEEKLSDCLIVYGGTNGKETFGDLWLFQQERNEWQRLIPQLNLPKLQRHAIVQLSDEELFVFGGLNERHEINRTGYVINLVSGEMTKLFFNINESSIFAGVYGHRMIALSHRRVICIGGVHPDVVDGSPLFVIDSESQTVFHLNIDGLQTNVLINHSVTDVKFEDERLAFKVVGGGLVCFSMGSRFEEEIIEIEIPLESIPSWKQRLMLNWVKSANLIDKISHNEMKSSVFASLLDKAVPFVISGADIGSCTELWKQKRFWMEKVRNGELQGRISVHKSQQKALNFSGGKKNFEYQFMEWEEFIENVFHAQDNEVLYLRSIGENPRKVPADFTTSFECLQDQLKVPEYITEMCSKSLNSNSVPKPDEKFFSSVLRISSPGLKLWTHYDAMDNVLLQVCSEKIAVLFPPECHADLELPPDIHSSSCPSSDLFSSNLPDSLKKALKKAWIQVLKPGDILYIPSFWFHNMSVLDGSDVPSISLNLFWRRYEKSLYENKDLYGNKDLVPAVQADKAVSKCLEMLQELPDELSRSFYFSRMLQKFKN